MSFGGGLFPIEMDMHAAHNGSASQRDPAHKWITYSLFLFFFRCCCCCCSLHLTHSFLFYSASAAALDDTMLIWRPLLGGQTCRHTLDTAGAICSLSNRHICIQSENSVLVFAVFCQSVLRSFLLLYSQSVFSFSHFIFFRCALSPHSDTFTFAYDSPS